MDTPNSCFQLRITFTKATDITWYPLFIKLRTVGIIEHRNCIIIVQKIHFTMEEEYFNRELERKLDLTFLFLWSFLLLIISVSYTFLLYLYLLVFVSLIQNYFLETHNEKDYFGRKATFTTLSEIHVEGRFSQFTRTAIYRPYPPTLSRLFLQIAGVKRKPSETRLYLEWFWLLYHFI